MNKLILTFLITYGCISTAYASQHELSQIKTISEKKIKQMDHTFTKHKAVKRDFRTHQEFKHRQKRKMMHNSHKPMASKSMRYNNYANGYNYNRPDYRDVYRPIRQRGHRHTKRGWVLAYQYDRASFYDSEGYFYGYFNRYGYYFEDVFYRYDRDYTYRDRIRGRGLFDYRYYMPTNASYYGFCKRDYDDSAYERGYNRY